MQIKVYNKAGCRSIFLTHEEHLDIITGMYEALTSHKKELSKRLFHWTAIPPSMSFWQTQ